jgi:hypothetical protein
MRRIVTSVGSLGVVAVAAWIQVGCSAGKGPGSEGAGAGTGANIPLVTPPVRAATPTGLQGSGMGSSHTNSRAGQLHANYVPMSVTVDGAAPPPDSDASPGDGGVMPGPGPSPDSGVGPGGDTCPGSGGVCPDGGVGPGPTPDGGMGPMGVMCPGNGGICPDGGMTPGGGMGAGPDGGTSPGTTGLDPSDIRSRFFSAGPTDIFSILAEIDGRISEINQRSNNQDAPCMSQPPVAYPLTPFGQPVTFYAQCVSHFSTPMPTDASFFQFGQKDGVTYLYEVGGAETIAARVTPAADGSGQYAVSAWLGVGNNNATSCGNASGFDDCSYGVMALEANPSRMHFELTVAGIGFGYCGAQLASDGMTVHLAGSPDMGATCADQASICVSASDVTMTTMCASTSFDLPAIGRAATSGPNGMWGASRNGSEAIVLDGTASDSLAFGPRTPTAGVPEFVTTPIGGDAGGPPPGGDASME